MNLDKWFKECILNIFLILNSGAYLAEQNKTVYTILEEGKIRNIYRIVFKYLPVVQEEMTFKNISCLNLWQLFCSAEPDDSCNFGKGIKRNISVKVF